MSIKDKLENIEQGLNIWDRIEIKIKNLILYLKGKPYRVNLKKLTKLEKEIIRKFYNSNYKNTRVSVDVNPNNMI